MLCTPTFVVSCQQQLTCSPWPRSVYLSNEMRQAWRLTSAGSRMYHGLYPAALQLCIRSAASDDPYTSLSSRRQSCRWSSRVYTTTMTLAGLQTPPTTVSAQRRRQTNLWDNSVPTYRTTCATVLLSTVQRACSRSPSLFSVASMVWQQATYPTTYVSSLTPTAGVCGRPRRLSLYWRPTQLVTMDVRAFPAAGVVCYFDPVAQWPSSWSIQRSVWLTSSY